MAFILPLDERSGFVFCKQFAFYCKNLSEAATSEENEIIDLKVITDAVPKITKDGNAEQQIEQMACEVLCCALSHSSAHFAVALANKFVIVFNSTDRSVVRAFQISKSPTVLVFDNDDKYILVADRAGHVTRYMATTNPGKVEPRRDLTGEMSNYEGEPLCGTMSMVLDLVVSPDNTSILTADKDEKIRVSRYPQGYVIKSFLLGHTEFVTSLAFYEDRFFSSGGDATIKEWNWRTSDLLQESEPFKLADQNKAEANAIRKIFPIVLNGKLHLVAFNYESKTVFLVTAENLQLVKSIALEDVPLHAALLGGVEFEVVARSGVYKINIGSDSVVKIPVGAKLAELLQDAAEVMPPQYKSQSQHGYDAYLEKKKAKFEELEKKKANLKRKHDDSNGDVATEEIVET